MAAEWAKLCQARDLIVEEPHVVIEFGDNRRHRVTVDEHANEYLLSALVARQSIVSTLPNLPMQVWLRNRAMSLVGFRIDHRGRLIAEAWVPTAGLTAKEFQHYLRSVAAEADRFEYVLTGKDSE